MGMKDDLQRNAKQLKQLHADLESAKTDDPLYDKAVKAKRAAVNLHLEAATAFNNGKPDVGLTDKALTAKDKAVEAFDSWRNGQSEPDEDEDLPESKPSKSEHSTESVSEETFGDKWSPKFIWMATATAGWLVILLLGYVILYMAFGVNIPAWLAFVSIALLVILLLLTVKQAFIDRDKRYNR